MLPDISPESIQLWMAKLTGYQRKVVKGRLMAELRVSWATLHQKLNSGFSEQEVKKVLEIFSDYLIITKVA